MFGFKKDARNRNSGDVVATNAGVASESRPPKSDR